MSITGGIVAFAVIWFVCLLVILPRGLTTQAEAGEVEPGTPEGAPSSFNFGRKALWTTLVTVVLWAGFFAILEYELLTMDDFDFIMPPTLRSDAKL